MFELAYYRDFHNINNKSIEKTIEFLKNGDFKSVESKKLHNTDYFRAKINYEDRLIFKFLKYKDKNYILLLEVILNHNYDKSSFLRGKKVIEEDFLFDKEEIEESIFINKSKEFKYIDKFISFNNKQDEILNLKPPLIVIGSAGSGKTSVIIEKLRGLEGKVLYISLSKYLVENSKEICGEDYTNIDFLSFEEFLNRVKKQNRKEIDFFAFKSWLSRYNIKDTEKYFEEFRGVITSPFEKSYLSKDEYLNMGVKQSIFTKDRDEVYEIFLKYLNFLKDSSFYDSNIESFELLDRVKKIYNFIVIDEVQDFTNMQIHFISKALKRDGNFIFSGDSNQILYSNFFSWSNLKTMLFHTTEDNQVKILTQSYRNSQKVSEIANSLLKIKQLKFGSIDKESNYLIESISNLKGNIHFYKSNQKVLEELNQEIVNSVKFAIITFDEKSKVELKKSFKTPLIFTVRETKGLEYENIVLVDFISNESDKFRKISENIELEDLKKDFNYSRNRDKASRELDTYKIYINSLYVAFTRSLKNIYIVESKHNQIYELFGLIEEKKESLKVQKSDAKEWQKEAEKLERLGKVEQVREIEDRVEPEVVKDDIFELKDEALNPKRFNKKAKDRFFEMVKERNQTLFIEKLAELKYAPARKYLKSLKQPKPKRKVLSKEQSKKIITYTIKGNFKKVKKLIQNGADVNVEIHGETALMVASEKGHREVVELLIQNGADIEAKNSKGFTALMVASLKGHREVVEYLTQNGADIEAKSSEGGIALINASLNGHREVVEYLMQNGADVNAKSSEGVTALIVASLNGHREVVEYLIQNGADVNAKGSKGATALMVASELGHREVVEYLIQNGADVNIKNSEGGTALIQASGFGHREVVEYLIQNGADVNAEINGATALMVASQGGHREVVELLKQAGAFDLK